MATETETAATAAEAAETPEAHRHRRTLQGLVVSNKMDKTVVIRVSRHMRDRRYGKYLRDSKKYMAHDENDQCEIGDLVTIVESRPLSRNKRWRVRSVDRKAVG